MNIGEAQEAILGAERLVFFTGAGMGADSGIPTFRGQSGLWHGFRAEELATPQAFQRDPEKVWEWYCWRRQLIAKAEPHAGHSAISRYQEHHPGTVVITQNVDGMHQRSGCSPVHELHGSIWRRRCLRCRKEKPDRETQLQSLPACDCGGLLRPAVVWFGEALPEATWTRSLECMQRADLVVVVGTSGVVQPAASMVGSTPESVWPGRSSLFVREADASPGRNHRRRGGATDLETSRTSTQGSAAQASPIARANGGFRARLARGFWLRSDPAE